MMMEQWMWWVLTLFFIVFTFYWADLRLLWASLATAVVGALTWHSPDLPMIYQLMIVVLITVGGVLITETFIKKKPGQGGDDEVLPSEDDYVGKVFTLEQPIVNGSGVIDFQGIKLRIRGEDAEAGTQVRIIAVDGIDRTLCLVEKVRGEGVT